MKHQRVIKEWWKKKKGGGEREGLLSEMPSSGVEKKIGNPANVIQFK